MTKNNGKGKASSIQPIAPRMLADTVVDAIVDAAAKGDFLPGDRIVEADLARRLNVSRVPVREALRLLESQGIVENTPYRGMRLMQVSPEIMRGMRKVRFALELLAAEDVREMAHLDAGILQSLEDLVSELAELARSGDSYGFALLDMEFHRQLIQMAENPALMRAWEQLARQLTVVEALSTPLQASLDASVEEHVALLDALCRGSARELAEVMEAHILGVPDTVNYDVLRNRDEQNVVN